MLSKYILPIFSIAGIFTGVLCQLSDDLIRPIIYDAKTKLPIANTFDKESGLHASHITLTYHHLGERIVVDLRLNEHLIPKGHFLRYQDSKRGGYVVQNLTKTEVDLCQYLGNIRDRPESRVAISTCNGGIKGVVHDGDETYFIHSNSGGRIQDDHFLFRHTDILSNATFGYDHNNDQEQPHNGIDRSDSNRYKRSSMDNIIRGPFNANKESSFVELVIVVDNKVYKSMGESMEKVHQHCKDLVNIVNAIYEQLNIYIALVGVVVWNESNEIEFSKYASVTLDNFLHYRRTKLAFDHPNDNAQLLTMERFHGDITGKALRGPICTYEYSGGIVVDDTKVVGVVATTMAHEMGHNFGLEHDKPNCLCRDKKCIMGAMEMKMSLARRHWSSCSINQLRNAFAHGMNHCLRNKPTKLFDSSQCGNGFVEPGEQCDCGLSEDCDNSCCDPSTCMLKPNAQCATGECCDLSVCRLKAAGNICRSTENECDLPEFCTGKSEYCPANVFKRDTEPCNDEKAYCYQGSCRTRDEQCRILFGPTGENSELCYLKNLNGNRHGNCGYDRVNNKYVKCADEDVSCGMLHCYHSNDHLEYGLESEARQSYSEIELNETIVTCQSAIIDFGLDSIDPGLTPNGAKCGTNKMCVNQRCMRIESLRQNKRSIGVTECPNNCSGNGVCNSKGNCHCFEKFSPPDCSGFGRGGSYDSGPTQSPDPETLSLKLVAVALSLLAVFVMVSLFLGYWYYKYYNRRRSSFEKLDNSEKGNSHSDAPTFQTQTSGDSSETSRIIKLGDKQSDTRIIPEFRSTTEFAAIKERHDIDETNSANSTTSSGYQQPLPPKIDHTYDEAYTISVDKKRPYHEYEDDDGIYQEAT